MSQELQLELDFDRVTVWPVDHIIHRQTARLYPGRYQPLGLPWAEVYLDSGPAPRFWCVWCEAELACTYVQETEGYNRYNGYCPGCGRCWNNT